MVKVDYSKRFSALMTWEILMKVDTRDYKNHWISRRVEICGVDVRAAGKLNGMGNIFQFSSPL